MLCLAFILGIAAVARGSSGYESAHKDHVAPSHKPATIDLHTREHWMRVAVEALHDLKSPCPFEAFGAVVVNHTSGGLGDAVCIGVNTISDDGNPTSHGEIAAINNCTSVLRDPNGPYKLSPGETAAAWKQLSLYTTAEACPMCAAAMRWAGFKEYIYATSSETLIENGWPQMSITSRELFQRSGMVEPSTAIVTDVLHGETDALFEWQFDSRAPCPAGCLRATGGKTCVPRSI
jgi:tRNA(Arg) A34 adenosine deaminase TadA